MAKENKKILKTRKQENPKKTDDRGITTPHSRNPLVGVGGSQLQPGVEDGGTPTEVVAEETKKILTRRNKKIQKQIW